jgi:membrane-associated phospholipid phosphatase
MEDLLNSGIPFILFLQNLGEWLLAPMKALTFLGEQEFYLLAAPLLYWCINRAAGLRFGVALMLSAGLNSFLKFIFHAPRPFWVDGRVQALAVETSFGLPSGHAQNSLAVFGSLTGTYRKRWVWAVVLLLTFLIGVSRMYLGVHYPLDALGGWLAGGLLLWAVLKWEQPTASWLKRQNLGVQFGALFAVSLLLILLPAAVRAGWSAWQIPASWVQNAVLALEAGEIFDPFSLSGPVSYGGALFGLAFGALLIERQGGFLTGGSLLQRSGRFLLGIVGVLVLFVGLDMIFPDSTDLIGMVFRYIRYALVTFWTSYLAPVVFLRLNLARAAQAAN